MMRIDFEEGSGQSRAPSRSRASHARAQEAQSAPPPPPPQSSVPSDLDARIKAISDMTDKIETEVGKLVTEVTKGNHDMVDPQEELKEKVENLSGHFEAQDARISTVMVSNVNLSDKLDKILKLLQHAGPRHSGSSFGTLSGPKNEPEPSTSPSFTFSTPIVSTSPIDSSTPATVIPPSHTSTVKIDSPPSTLLVEPFPEDSILAPLLFAPVIAVSDVL